MVLTRPHPELRVTVLAASQRTQISKQYNRNQCGELQGYLPQPSLGNVKTKGGSPEELLLVLSPEDRWVVVN